MVELNLAEHHRMLIWIFSFAIIKTIIIGCKKQKAEIARTPLSLCKNQINFRVLIIFDLKSSSDSCKLDSEAILTPIAILFEYVIERLMGYPQITVRLLSSQYFKSYSTKRDHRKIQIRTQKPLLKIDDFSKFPLLFESCN